MSQAMAIKFKEFEGSEFDVKPAVWNKGKKLPEEVKIKLSIAAKEYAANLDEEVKKARYAKAAATIAKQTKKQRADIQSKKSATMKKLIKENPNFTAKRAEKFKQAIAKKRKAGIVPKTAKKVFVCGVEYLSIADAAKDTGLSEALISTRAKNSNCSNISFTQNTYKKSNNKRSIGNNKVSLEDIPLPKAVMSEEAKAKLRAANLGKKRSPAARAAMSAGQKKAHIAKTLKKEKTERFL
jgi:hypothetical protein